MILALLSQIVFLIDVVLVLAVIAIHHQQILYRYQFAQLLFLALELIFLVLAEFFNQYQLSSDELQTSHHLLVFQILHLCYVLRQIDTLAGIVYQRILRDNLSWL